jgi:membrane peptidoglycan carboxypeptidase
VTRSVPHSIAAGTTLFLIVSAAASAGMAAIYARGITRLDADRSIAERELRILARPIRVTAGDHVAKSRLEDHLRQIGYYPGCADHAGCYQDGEQSLTIWARYRELSDAVLTWDGPVVDRIASLDGRPLDAALIEPETILVQTADPSGTSTRTLSDPIPFAAIANTPLVDAIVASEDRGFQQHHGIDFPRLALTPLVGGGASTITMQVARLNVLHDRSRTIRRKVDEIAVAMAVERTHTKAEILDAYVNSVYIGARRGRSVHGFGAAAREFYAIDDVRQLTPVQAATLVALLNQPSRYLDDLHDGERARLRRQRNRVLGLMHKTFPERYPEAAMRAAAAQPVGFADRSIANDALQKISRHFLDYAAVTLPAAGHVYLTLDPALQRLATDLVEQGLADLEHRFARLKTSQLQAALVVTNPRSGDVLAMVGGRSYQASQFNRAASAERQVGSIIKPFDYLAAFERAAAEDRTDISPATLVADVPTVFTFAGFRPWKPANYDHDYAGTVTWRRALAQSRNVAAVHVAAWAGFDRIAALWEAASGRQIRQVFPSMALGAIQATPVDVARAYAVFATGGIARPLRTIGTADRSGSSDRDGAARRVARVESTETVAAMMRAVLDEGTGRAARTRGFTAAAAGKTGTTDLLRDAWFAGFTGDLLAVVWVGRDDDRPLGLTGAQAALPIWTEFMKRATQN